MSLSKTSPHQLTYFSEAHPVRASVSPGHDWGLPMSVTSGLKWHELSGQNDRALSLWKTCLAAIVEASLTQYETTWKTKVTPQRRLSFLLQYSVRPMNVSGFLSSGLWPTPNAGDTSTRAPSPTPYLTRNGTLRHINKAGTQSQMQLSQVVKLWVTPVVRNHKNGARGYLNPDWVELLMGLPAGWTALPSPTSPDSRQGRVRTSTTTNRPAWWRISHATMRRASARSATRSFGSRRTRLRRRWYDGWKGAASDALHVPGRPPHRRSPARLAM